MATLNIKNFPDDLYRKLQERARRQHRSVEQELTHLLEQALADPGSRSLLELDGLGKDLWTGSDAADHVDRERAPWDE